MSDQIQNLQQFARQHGVAPEAVRSTGKPSIFLPGGSTRIQDTAQALFEVIAAKHIWFSRGGTVVLITQENGKTLPVAQFIKAPRARSEFEKHADLLVMEKGGRPAPAVMSEDTAKALLESSVAREVLPQLNGLLNCPLLILRDGALHPLQPGYNETTGYYLTGTAAKEPETVEEAVTLIKGAVADFSYQSAGDISRTLASILTPALLLGGFIRGRVPIEIVEANDSQTGKGYLVLLRSAFYGEVPTYVVARKGGVGSLDESFASPEPAPSSPRCLRKALSDDLST